VLGHDCEVVTGAACWLCVELPVLWLESDGLLGVVLSLSLCAELVLAPSSSLRVLVDEPDDPEVVVVVVAPVVLAPLPSAATASQAVTNVARTPAVTRRRTVRRRCLTGEAGGCMSRIVAEEPWILLGIRSALGKTEALRFLFDWS
jgi:hypothetical protein